MENEIWKDVNGFEGLYQISTEGNIRSVSRVIKDRNGYTKNILSKAISPAYVNGYKRVALVN